MTWTAPLTATASAALTAAQWNASVRDNLLATAPALATTVGSMFVGTAANAIAERIPTSTGIGTSETTSNTGYTDLTTAGPALTATASTRVFAFVSAQMTNNTVTSGCFTSVAVSGATTVAATDGSALVYYPGTAGNPMQATRLVAQGVNAGSNIFTVKYRVAAGTGTFSQRNLALIPF